MPVKSLRKGDSCINQSVCCNEAITDVDWLRCILEKYKELVEDERLAYSECQKRQSRNDDSNNRPS
jgi:hypothetical protein